VEFLAIALVAALVLAYSLVSRRIETTPITGPMVFVTLGIITGPAGVDLLDIGMGEGVVRVLAQATLVLVLFTDAVRIDLSRLRFQLDLPARLLGLGLPFTVVAGTVIGMLLLPGFGLWEAALTAAILTPTDAALGRAVVTSPHVPVRIRQALNVESGLNDGLVLPLVTVLLALAAVGVDLETPAYWFGFVAAQLGFGVLFGVLVGVGSFTISPRGNGSTARSVSSPRWLWVSELSRSLRSWEATVSSLHSLRALLLARRREPNAREPTTLLRTKASCWPSSPSCSSERRWPGRRSTI
jgi:NhaP-type Na+/H+ or K+/H+ antiporter